MKKKYRIRKNEEFASIISKKHSVACDSFVLYFDNKKEDYGRAGISVSKKMGDAVTRNKIKRQIRMMLLSSFDFDNSNIDLVLIARKRYLDKDFIANQTELEKLIKRAII